MQRFDRKRLQINGLFKSRRGSPPRIPVSRCAAFIATNAVQMQLQKLQTQLKSPLDAAQHRCTTQLNIAAQHSSTSLPDAAQHRCTTQLYSPPDAAQRSSKRCPTQLYTAAKRSFHPLQTQLPITAFKLPDTAFGHRIHARMQDLRLTRSNTS